MDLLFSTGLPTPQRHKGINIFTIENANKSHFNLSGRNVVRHIIFRRHCCGCKEWFYSLLFMHSCKGNVSTVEIGSFRGISDALSIIHSTHTWVQFVRDLFTTISSFALHPNGNETDSVFMRAKTELAHTLPCMQVASDSSSAQVSAELKGFNRLVPLLLIRRCGCWSWPARCLCQRDTSCLCLPVVSDGTQPK